MALTLSSAVHPSPMAKAAADCPTKHGVLGITRTTRVPSGRFCDTQTQKEGDACDEKAV